jgi:uncharacterized protein
MAGKFTWFDLMTTDPEGAVGFYTKTLGWTTTKWEGPMPYTMFSYEGEMLGGVMPLPDDARKMGAPPHWLGYVAVDDVEKSVQKASGLGATVYMKPQEIPNTGKFAVLADPQGATFAMFQSTTPRAEGASEQPKAVGWVELYTSDLDQAWDFYSKLFGWRKTDSMDMGGNMGLYQMFTTDGNSMGGMMKRPAQMPVSAWNFYFRTDDTHTRTELATKNGAKVINGPIEVPGGDWVSTLLDPQGGTYSIYGPKKA